MSAWIGTDRCAEYSACVVGVVGGGEMEEANAAMKEPPKVVLRCKLCMVGDAAVGKTALTEVYTKGGSKFPKNYSMVGVLPPVQGAGNPFSQRFVLADRRPDVHRARGGY